MLAQRCFFLLVSLFNDYTDINFFLTRDVIWRKKLKKICFYDCEAILVIKDKTGSINFTSKVVRLIEIFNFAY